MICSCSALKSVVHKMAECHNSVHDRKATPFEAAAGFPERSPNIEGRNSWCARWPSLFINHALHENGVRSCCHGDRKVVELLDPGEKARMVRDFAEAVLGAVGSCWEP